MSDGTAKFPCVFALIYVVPLFYRAESFLKRHQVYLPILLTLTPEMIIQEPVPDRVERERAEFCCACGNQTSKLEP
jgi:hypothetical protein